ncbi:hypothetical protein [Campylobacter pinnipediorum]|uniref:hypothetical protein n=1 Tax=Campylobacter pinnipediorum TaxID=1965231 RepID=UPI00084CF008|nr:hypothetical protein [Campylobacter pinnipediorum]
MKISKIVSASILSIVVSGSAFGANAAKSSIEIEAELKTAQEKLVSINADEKVTKEKIVKEIEVKTKQVDVLNNALTDT